MVGDIISWDSVFITIIRYSFCSENILRISDVILRFAYAVHYISLRDMLFDLKFCGEFFGS
jgi:hypothetical protein